MQTLVPIGTFEDRARALLGDLGFDQMLGFLAERPKVGRIIQGAGGLRKVRIARPGGVKSGWYAGDLLLSQRSETTPLAVDIYQSAAR